MWRSHVLVDGLVDDAVLDGRPLVPPRGAIQVLHRYRVEDHRDNGEPEEEGHVADLVAPHVVDLEVGPQRTDDTWQQEGGEEDGRDGVELHDYPQHRHDGGDAP